MSQIVPQLSYPGGCSAFFTDLHFDFSRWLRLVALVPLVHASIEGIYSEKLCSHLLDILPASSPSNILAVSVERIRSLVSEMLFEEPFFVVRSFHTKIRFVALLTPCPPQCPFSDGKSTSRWIYEPSLDSEPSRISFAFRILLCVKLYPNWSASDLLSRVACITHPRTPSFTVPNVLETCRQRDRFPSGNEVSDAWFLRSNSVPPIRVPISLLIETSVSPMKAGQDPSDHLESSFSSGSDQTIISDPLHPPRSLDIHPEAELEAIGSKPSTFDLGTRHLSGPYEVPLRSFASPVLSIVRPRSAGADLAMDAQQYKGISDFPVLLGQSPIFSSGSCCDLSDSPRAKIPLFLPSQTPSRDFPPQGFLSSQASGSNERTSPLSVQSHSRVLPHNDYSHVSPLCTSALQNVDANDLEAISLHDGQFLHVTNFTTPKPTKSPWPIEFASDDRPRTPAQRKIDPPRHQRSDSLGKRDRQSSGCAANKTRSSWALDARGDSASGETPVRVQGRRGVELASRG
jgi:hypothetical protein